MDPKILAVIGVIVIVGLAAALFIGGGGGTSNETSSTTTTTQPPFQTTTTTQPSGSSELEGTWQGTYTSSHGSGTWKWVIKKTGENQYVGCLYTQGPYPTQAWIPLQIQVNGDQITLGTIGGVAVTFTGTFQGSSASGTWHSPYDQGSWQGSKISSNNNLPCQMPGETTTTTTTETTTTTSTTSTGGSQGLTCIPSPPDDLSDTFNSITSILQNTIGQLSCQMANLQENEYDVVLTTNSFDPNNANQYITEIVQALQNQGWYDIYQGSQAQTYITIGASYNATNGRIDLVLQIYYAGGSQANIGIGIALIPSD